MACRQINKISVDGNIAKLFIRDQAAISMITSEKYGKILTEYLDNLGFKWQVVGTNTTTGGNVNDLASKLGGRLEIR